MEMQTFEEVLFLRLKDALKRLAPSGILLSGGIDSGLLACLSPKLRAVTVRLGDQAKDSRYLVILKERLEIEVETVEVTLEDALRALPDVVRILRSFDPALPNDLTVYFGLKAFSEMGIGRVITGDGGDELFGGYDYMVRIEDLEAYQQELLPHLYFSSSKIGEALGVKVLQPYLEPEVVEFALQLPRDWKIREAEGRLWGKWILRKALERYLPPEFAWQDKRPLEVGSGMTALRERIAQGISDSEFEEKSRRYGINFLCKEHLYFYEIYREVVGEIPKPRPGEVACPHCGAGKPPNRSHCRVCGMKG